MDIATLSAHICLSENTIEKMVRQGTLPPPKQPGGKRLWKWKDVERYLEGEQDDVSPSPDDVAERIRNATRSAAQGH